MLRILLVLIHSFNWLPISNLAYHVIGFLQTYYTVVFRIANNNFKKACWFFPRENNKTGYWMVSWFVLATFRDWHSIIFYDNELFWAYCTTQPGESIELLLPAQAARVSELHRLIPFTSHDAFSLIYFKSTTIGKGNQKLRKIIKTAGHHLHLS